MIQYLSSRERSRKRSSANWAQVGRFYIPSVVNFISHLSKYPCNGGYLMFRIIVYMIQSIIQKVILVKP